MKCVECENEAVVVLQGNSLCREHLPEEVKKKINNTEHKKMLEKQGFKTRSVKGVE